MTYSFQLTFGETLRADIGMNGYSAVQYLLFVAIVTALVSPLGGYMHRVFTRQRTVLDHLCGPAERLIYRLTPPHGYRSAVAYDAAAKAWITVGLSGTDISTDDGRNWRALRPNPALNEPADADQHSLAPLRRRPPRSDRQTQCQGAGSMSLVEVPVKPCSRQLR